MRLIFLFVLFLLLLSSVRAELQPAAPLSDEALLDQVQQQTFNYFWETRLNSYYNEVEVSGNLAFGRGTAEVTLIPKNGDSTTTSVSKYLNILQKQPNGKWKTTHDIWNGNQ